MLKLHLLSVLFIIVKNNVYNLYVNVVEAYKT